jgi:hypothetical protein
VKLFVVLASTCALAVGAFSQSKPAVDFSRLVVVGDSLSAGVQNFSLLDTQQPNGYAALIAGQAGTAMTLPLVPYPGAPNVLTLVRKSVPPIILPAPGTLPNPPRDNPTVQATNVSIPGLTVADAFLAPSQISPLQGPVAAWAEIVLGYPGPAASQVDEALALNPSAIIMWLGNNDALVPAITGQLDGLTPLPVFTAAYTKLIATLAATNASLITANIPDVTEIPFFTPVPRIAKETGLPLSTVTSVLGVSSSDYLRTTAVPIALGLLAGTPPPPPYVWPTSCPLPSPGLLPPGVPLPCVFTSANAVQVRSVIASYNNVITQQAAAAGVPLVDIHSLITEIVQNGYKTGDECLTAYFLGGLFSLDGIHPTNTGYAVIANAFIDQMNEVWGAGLDEVNVHQIAENDPLVLSRVRCRH